MREPWTIYDEHLTNLDDSGVSEGGIEVMKIGAHFWLESVDQVVCARREERCTVYRSIVS